MNRERRQLLKLIGVSSVPLVSGAESVTAEDGPEKKLHPNTESFDALEDVTVSLYEDGRTKVEMSGKKEGQARPVGYRVVVTGATNAQGEPTPENAEATVRSVPQRQLPSEQSSDDSSVTETQSGSTTSSDVGTLSHGGGDNESDYEGGMWMRTEDPADITVTKTEHWIAWSESGGNVTWDHRAWNATAYTVSLPENPGENDSIWKIDDAGHDYITDGSRVESKVHADYYNYTWSYDRNKTESHHRSWCYGNADGSLDWSSSHWHSGEDASLLRVDAGIYADNPKN